MSGAREFLDAVSRKQDRRYAREPAHDVIDITAVVPNAAGTGSRVVGTIAESDAEVQINARDRALTVGTRILARRRGDDLVGPEYEFVQVLASTNPAEGYLLIDANIPYPDFASPPFETYVTSTPGAIQATLVIRFVQVAEAHRPSGYKVSWRPAGTTDWQDQHVLHRTGDAIQVCQLSNALAPGSQVDVKLATEVNWAQRASPEGPVQTFDVAADDASPGSVTAIAVDTATPGLLNVTLAASVDSNLLLGYIYQVATSAGGAGVQSTSYQPSRVNLPLAPGTYYVAAYPLSKSLVAGGRWPVSGFQGPYTVAALPPGADITPPPVPPAPLVEGEAWQGADYVLRAKLRVTPDPGYEKPLDFAHFIVIIEHVDTGLVTEHTIDESAGVLDFLPTSGSPPAPSGVGLQLIFAAPNQRTYEWPVAFGSYRVRLVAVDRTENRSFPSPAAAVTIAAPDLPEGMANVTTEDRGLGIRVRWARAEDAVMYQLWRADDASGTNDATRGEPTAALSYLDILAEGTDVEIPATTYYYKVQALNALGFGPLSPDWIPGTASGVSGRWLLFDSMSGNVIEVGTLTADRLAAILTITQILKTAVSGTRWELEGHTGDGDQDQLRFYLLTTLAMMLNGTGLYFYGAGGQTDFSLARNGSNRGQLTMGALIVGTDGIGPFVQIPLTQTGGGGEIRFVGAAASARLREQSFQGLSAVGFSKLNGTIGDPALVLHDTVGGGSGNEKLALSWDGIAVDNDAMAAPASWSYNPALGTWVASAAIFAPKVWAGEAPSGGYSVYPLSVALDNTAAQALGPFGGDAIGLIHTEFSSKDNAGVVDASHRFRAYAYRGQSNATGYADVRTRLDVATNDAVQGGGIDVGWRNGAAFASLHAAGVARLYLDEPNSRVLVTNSFRVDGTLSKSAGTFDIDHPDPAKADRWRLRHGFAEGPTRGENLYTYVVSFGPRGGRLRVEESEGKAVEGATIATLEDGGVARFSVAIPLPDYWPHLNERPRCWVQTNGDGWGRARARVSADLATLTLEAEEGGEHAILLIGTRKDGAARRMWDRRGAVYSQAQRTDNASTLERRAATLAARARRDGRKARGTPVAPAFDAGAMLRAMRGGDVIEEPTEASRAMAAAMGRALAP